MFFSGLLFCEKVATLTEVLKPTNITIDKYIYVNERTTINIYNKEDYTFIKKFGKEGEGPQEFKSFAAIIPQKENLLINSVGKVSCFSKKGEFIREIKAKGGAGNNVFWPLNNGYIGRTNTVEEKIAYFTVNLYDKDLKKIKEVYRIKSFVQMQSKGKIFWPPSEPTYQTYKDNIIIAGKPGFIIDILSGSGKPLFTIEEKNYKKRKFTSEDKKVHSEYLKRRYKQRYEGFKQYLAFKDYFAEIADVFIDSNKIYALTWKFKDGQFEIFEYDIKGKFIKKFLANIAMQEVLEPYPMGIKNGKLYQLIENEDEEWDLYITKLDE